MGPGNTIDVNQVAEHLWVVEVAGEHDLSTVGQLDDAISHVLAAGSRMVIDFTAASFIDSTILGCVIRGREEASKDESDDLVIVAPSGTMPRRVIDMTGITAWVPVFEDRESALSAIS
jgi:anti-sigma B factor antagonist